MFLKYIYFCFYINLKYLIIHDHIDLIQHFDAFHTCCLNDFFIKYLYVNYKIYILFVDNVNDVQYLIANYYFVFAVISLNVSSYYVYINLIYKYILLFEIIIKIIVKFIVKQ